MIPAAISLRARVEVLATSLIVILVGAVAYFSYTALSSTVQRDAETFLKTKAHDLSVLLQKSNSDFKALQDEADWQPPTLQYSHVYAAVMDESGKTQVHTHGVETEVPEATIESLRVKSSGKEPIEFESQTGKPMICISLEVATQQGRRLHLWVGMDLSRQADTLARQRFFLETLLGVSILAALLIAYLLARAATDPINRLSAMTDKLDRLESEQLKAEFYPKELRPLVQALNQMRNRLAEQIRSLSSFAENLAHEMRNPINILIGEAELGLARSRSEKEYRDTLVSALEEYRELARLIDSLLFIARAENKAEVIQPKIFNLQSAVESLVDFYFPLADEKGIQVEVDVPPGIELKADQTLFNRAVGNLLVNAVQHGKSHGRIKLTARQDSVNGTKIEVLDDGPGIDPVHHPFLFDRFYRASHAATGGRGAPELSLVDRSTGLGLSIVQSIMKLHQGHVQVTSSLGHGAKFELFFP